MQDPAEAKPLTLPSGTAPRGCKGMVLTVDQEGPTGACGRQARAPPGKPPLVQGSPAVLTARTEADVHRSCDGDSVTFLGIGGGAQLLCSQPGGEPGKPTSSNSTLSPQPHRALGLVLETASPSTILEGQQGWGHDAGQEGVWELRSGIMLTRLVLLQGTGP